MSRTAWNEAPGSMAHGTEGADGPDVLSNPALALACMRFGAQGADIRTLDEFKTWVTLDLKRIFPHEAFLAFFTTADPGGDTSRISSLTPIDFPVRYAEALRTGTGRVRTPIVQGVQVQRTPQLFNRGDAHGHPPGWIENFERFDLHNIAAHGVADPGGRRSSMFSFHRIPDPVGPWHAEMLKVLTPHLHAAYARVVALSQPGSGEHPCFGIRREEMEVLHWLAKGKSNGDISAITGRSQATVKRQVAQLLATLGVATRTQAAARAVHWGLIEDPHGR
jgi:DNA-binding CsgD family transcriptional regulator